MTDTVEIGNLQEKVGSWMGKNNWECIMFGEFLNVTEKGNF